MHLYTIQLVNIDDTLLRNATYPFGGPWVFEFAKVWKDILLKIGPGFFGGLLHCVRFAASFLDQFLDFIKVKILGLGPQHNHWYFTESSFMITIDKMMHT